ncbi:protein refolding chaperone Spy/CpxP family [Dyella sp. OK004]|uniref:Spy/CpxP family protein refolding chaperone n=1 Tax=Dyella sp. OK004 TaxID=1855292 RepID=UPI0008E80BB7|nr:Spy/CpxP family protein refolding chaperone [Dyella sp. OK004]SFS02739.1 protein refolding chaperone Spy/CpxP family [Dyella sp. OK004]
MRKNLLLGLALASAMTLTTVAVAAGQDGGFRGDHGHGHRGHAMLAGMDKLNLTDAQRTSIKQLVKSSFEQNKSQRQNLRQQREAFEAMTPDQVGYQSAAATFAQAEASALQARIQQRAALRTQIYALLTPAQKTQLASLKAERQERKQQWEQFKSQHPVSSPSGTTSAQ